MKIGVIGAGYIGRAVASHSVQQGYEVMISNSRGPETLSNKVVEIGCKAGTSIHSGAFRQDYDLHQPIPMGKVKLAEFVSEFAAAFKK